MIPKSVIEKIKRLEISTRKIVQSGFSGNYQSAFKGQGINFSDLREYYPGDDVRHINWSVSARSSTPQVKLYSEERELTVYIMVDLSGSNNFGSKVKSKVEILAEIAAVLGFSANQNNDKVGLILFTDHVELFIPAKKGRTHMLRILREIIYFQPKRKQTNLSESLSKVLNFVKKRSIFFLLSDFLDEGYQHNLGVLAKKHDLVPIFISDPLETELTKCGLIALEDDETGEILYVNTSSSNLREAYKTMAFAQKMKTERLFKQLSLSWVYINNTNDYLPILAKFFKNRIQKLR